MNPNYEQVFKSATELNKEVWNSYTGARKFMYWEGTGYCFDSQNVFYVSGKPMEIDWELDVFRNLRSKDILKRLSECS